MIRRPQAEALCAAIAILIVSVAIGATAALIARAGGTPTTSERVLQSIADDRPVNP